MKDYYLLIGLNRKEVKITDIKEDGNEALTYPVGLITLDEVVLAGFNTYYSNTSDYKDTTNYLYTNSIYWTFSPVIMKTTEGAYVGHVTGVGNVYISDVSNAGGVRPVVSLADGTLVNSNGDGTRTNPYVVE